jgi:uncharacterized protein YkwD
MRSAAVLAAWMLLSGTVYAQSAGRLEQALNDLRSRPVACAGAAPALAASPRLAAVAAAIAAAPGLSLSDALREAGYRSRRTVLWHISGISEPAALARYAEQSFCRDLHATDLAEIGVFAVGAGRPPGTWIVLAQPITLPDAEDMPAIGRRVLALVNRARANGRYCGKRRFDSAPPVDWDDRLAAAGLAHAAEMAQYETLDHAGRNGSRPGDRARGAGYSWQAIGENIASGPPTPEQVTAGWIASPPHCANLMNPAYTAMGAAYAVNPHSRMGIFWDQLFGAPR